MGVASSIWFIGQGMVWRMPLGSQKGTLPTLLLKSPSTGPSWGLVRGPGTVPQRMPLTLHLSLTPHCMPRPGLLAAGLYPLARTLSDLFPTLCWGCFSLAWWSCEVALTGFTGVTGFTRVLEAALLHQGCGYDSA